MGIDQELERQAYEHGDREGPAEIWVNKTADLGVQLEWFMLEGSYYERWNTKIGNGFVKSNE